MSLTEVAPKLREIFVIEFSGGPYDTQRHEAPGQLDWPLPQFIYARVRKGKPVTTEGIYVKEWESEGEAQDSSEARGAIYKWRENDE